jgi:hypothetical protein
LSETDKQTQNLNKRACRVTTTTKHCCYFKTQPRNEYDQVSKKEIQDKQTKTTKTTNNRFLPTAPSPTTTNLILKKEKSVLLKESQKWKKKTFA